MLKIVLKIDGMMYSMCEAHVNDAIRKAIPGAQGFPKERHFYMECFRVLWSL